MDALPAQVAVHQEDGLVVSFGKGQRQVDSRQGLAFPGPGTGDHHGIPALGLGPLLDFSSQNFVGIQLGSVRLNADTAVFNNSGCVQLNTGRLGIYRGRPVTQRRTESATAHGPSKPSQPPFAREAARNSDGDRSRQ